MKHDPSRRTPGDAEAQALYAAGLRASELGQSDKALEFWRESLSLRPFAPHVHHHMGVEFTQIGRHGDALLHMALALEQDANYQIARLQLALLWLTQSAPNQAMQVLQPMLTQTPDDALTDFAAALHSLACGDGPKAREHLYRGMARKTENTALKTDMHRLLDAIESAGASGARAVTSTRDAFLH